ncbi:autophagy protein Apg5 [Nitzschia inconspicua]|uniref:Autophagy protein 5 n=1 Tax=Nitzschia inconspicua TaxID=303405 RepID=A0A9K3LP56_9STRA|nr:autophagy protein Apg5 [Nitzschia inconspicua]
MSRVDEDPKKNDVASQENHNMTPSSSLHPSTRSNLSLSAAAAEQIRSLNWQGRIPIVLTLAQTSLSSTTIPPPIHALVSRHSFLHTGLEDAVRQLHEYAPPSFAAFGNKRMQVEEPDLSATNSSSSEEETNHDMTVRKENGNNLNKNDSSNRNAKQIAPYPVCWFEDENTQEPLKWHYFVGVLFDSVHLENSTASIPWKIRLHFHSYPSQTLLELDPASGVMTTVERTFKHALKQALVLLHGNNKVALNLSKQSHECIWKAIQTVNYDSLYKPIWVQEFQPKENDVKLLPVRLWIHPSAPMIQRRWDCSTDTVDSSNSQQVLGSLLCQWAPQYFEEENSNHNSFRAKSDSIKWRIAGVTPPLSSPLLDLWKSKSKFEHSIDKALSWYFSIDRQDLVWNQ